MDKFNRIQDDFEDWASTSLSDATNAQIYEFMHNCLYGEDNEDKEINEFLCEFLS
jgi:hypothetical protein